LGGRWREGRGRIGKEKARQTGIRGEVNRPKGKSGFWKKKRRHGSQFGSSDEEKIEKSNEEVKEGNRNRVPTRSDQKKKKRDEREGRSGGHI